MGEELGVASAWQHNGCGCRQILFFAGDNCKIRVQIVSMSILHADPEPFTAQKFEFGLEFRFSHIVLTERPFGVYRTKPKLNLKLKKYNRRG